MPDDVTAPPSIDALLASAIYDSENTARLQEHPEDLEVYLTRSRALLHHMKVLGLSATLAPAAPVEGMVERYKSLRSAARYALEAINTGRSEPLFIARDALQNALDDLDKPQGVGDNGG